MSTAMVIAAVCIVLNLIINHDHYVNETTDITLTITSFEVCVGGYTLTVISIGILIPILLFSKRLVNYVLDHYYLVYLVFTSERILNTGYLHQLDWYWMLIFKYWVKDVNKYWVNEFQWVCCEWVWQIVCIWNVLQKHDNLGQIVQCMFGDSLKK